MTPYQCFFTVFHKESFINELTFWLKFKTRNSHLGFSINDVRNTLVGIKSPKRTDSKVSTDVKTES